MCLSHTFFEHIEILQTRETLKSSIAFDGKIKVLGAHKQHTVRKTHEQETNSASD